MDQNDLDGQLRLIRKAALAVSEQENLAGYCGVVSLLVMNLYGGCLLTKKVKGIRHYWNRLDDGREIDLTSCQFGGDGWNALTKGRKVPDRHIPELADMVHLLIYKQMLDYIEKLGGNRCGNSSLIVSNGMTTMEFRFRQKNRSRR